MENAEKRVRKGMQFSAWGSDWTVVRSERGRRGEERTVYVIERGDGHRETRSRSTVLAQMEVR